MAVREVILFGDPLLRRKSKRLREWNSKSTRQVRRDLQDTLIHLQKKHKRGGGLAAVQIGHLIQIIYLRAAGKSFYMINPRIIKKSKGMFTVQDFCFSGAAAFTAPVARHKSITVAFQDENGEKQTATYRDYFAELVQHEIDHLHGRLFIDLIKKPAEIVMIK